MKTIAIKMKSYAGNVNIVNNYNIEKRIFNILIFSLGFLVLIYVIFLGNMVFNIVERKAMEADARIFSTDVGNLELTFLSMSNKIDLTFSRSLGFIETKTKFATRKSLGRVSPMGESLGSLKIVKNEI